jgi:competence protein ComEA
MRSIYNVLIGVIAGFLLAGALFLVSRSPEGQAVSLQPAPTETPMIVHVIGAVPRPGVYELPEGSRVRDAIQAAGGLLADADTASLNLAALVEDGQQVDIPFGDGSSGFVVITEEPLATRVPGAEELIDLNTATVEELDSLPGIGPTTAQKIVDYREANGPFQRIEDIMNVSGIGPATFEEIEELITV